MCTTKKIMENCNLLGHREYHVKNQIKRQLMLPLVMAFIMYLGAFLLTPSMARAAAQNFEIDAKKSGVAFTSKAPFETFVGSTHAIKGYVTLDEKNLLASKAMITVAVDGIKTGNRLRDKDMRVKFMETKKYPEIRFELQKIISGPRTLSGGTNVQLMADGVFTIHGVAKHQKVELFVARDMAGNTITVQTKFPIVLGDYQIERPKFLLMKLAESVDVSVKLVLNEN